jgi:hypothetical protein
MTEIIVHVEVGSWGKAGRYFEQIGKSIEKMHTHDNKAQLDSIDEDKLNDINDSIEKKHTHDNKAQLDAIDAKKMTDINDGIEKKHSHSNKAQLDKIDEDLVKKLLVAVSNIDNHENRELLDRFGVDENGNLTYNNNPISGERPTASMTISKGEFQGYSHNENTISILTWEEIIPVGTEIKTIKIKYNNAWIDIHELNALDTVPFVLNMHKCYIDDWDTQGYILAVIGIIEIAGVVATALKSEHSEEIEEIEIVYYTDGGAE